MTKFIKIKLKKLKKSDDQTNMDKYRVDANITEYHILSKLNFLRLIIPKFMKKRRLFYVKNVCKNIKNQHVLNWTYGLFDQNYRAAFYILPNSIRNHHTEFEIHRTILTCQN